MTTDQAGTQTGEAQPSPVGMPKGSCEPDLSIPNLVEMLMASTRLIWDAWSAGCLAWFLVHRKGP